MAHKYNDIDHQLLYLSRNGSLPATRTTLHLPRNSREVCAEKMPLDPPEAGVDLAQLLVDLCPEIADIHSDAGDFSPDLCPEFADFSPDLSPKIADLSLEVGDRPVQVGERLDHPADQAGERYGHGRYENEVEIHARYD